MKSLRRSSLTITVIIPTLNEERQIEHTLRAVRKQKGPKEIIVVDGGSVDETVMKASCDARVLRGARGRASQMNRGAAASTGDVLLFLHADTLLPPQALDRIREVLSDPSVAAGAFRLQFDRETPLLRFYAWCTRFPIPKMCFGDRGLFVRREVFDAIGGFPEVPIFEDLEMVRRLHCRGGFSFMEQAVTTSARRFVRKGTAWQQLRNAFLWAGYMLGIPPERLRSFYSYRKKE